MLSGDILPSLHSDGNFEKSRKGCRQDIPFCAGGQAESLISEPGGYGAAHQKDRRFL